MTACYVALCHVFVDVVLLNIQEINTLNMNACIDISDNLWSKSDTNKWVKPCIVWDKLSVASVIEDGCVKIQLAKLQFSWYIVFLLSVNQPNCYLCLCCIAFMSPYLHKP